MKKDLVSEEIKNYPQEYLNNLFMDQLHNAWYIDNRCKNCKLHRVITLEDYEDLHVCNDNWSKVGGNKGVGEHVFYCETKDLCLECGGFSSMKRLFHGV